MMNFTDYDQITVHTDGACEGNPGPGGWAAIFSNGGAEIARASGKDAKTTNNRMELKAAIEALKLLADAPGMAITVHSDSQYVTKGVNDYLAGWKRNGWLKADKKPVLNVEMWQELDALIEARTVKAVFVWVKGHAGNRWNEEADQLANAAVNGKAKTIEVAAPQTSVTKALADLKQAQLVQQSAFKLLADLCEEADWDTAATNRMGYAKATQAGAVQRAADACAALEAAVSAT